MWRRRSRSRPSSTGGRGDRRGDHLWRTLVLRQITMAAAFACLVVGFSRADRLRGGEPGLHRAPPSSASSRGARDRGSCRRPEPPHRSLAASVRDRSAASASSPGDRLGAVHGGQPGAALPGRSSSGRACPCSSSASLTLRNGGRPPSCRGECPAAADNAHIDPTDGLHRRRGPPCSGSWTTGCCWLSSPSWCRQRVFYLLTRREQWERPATVAAASAPAASRAVPAATAVASAAAAPGEDDRNGVEAVPKPAPIVVVGAGLAGLRACEGLRARGHDGAIVLVGEEPHLPYDRPPLSKQFPRR